ncbi:MAG: 2-amino-4-hydroxy-6-hydroxymethyldihydropteridine diphosphokinase [Candidatus Limisoma sp.]
MMSIYVVSIGSNAVDKSERLAFGFDELRSRLDVVARSEAYVTPALNGRDADYLNAVAVLRADIDLDKLTAMLKHIETLAGRTPQSKMSGVIPLDIDTVIADGKVVRPGDFNQKYFQIGWNQIKSLSIWQNINDSDR